MIRLVFILLIILITIYIIYKYFPKIRLLHIINTNLII